MKTAVQLRRRGGKDKPKTELVCGIPSSIVTGRRGPVALFDSGQLVGYQIRYRRRMRLFVFRTLEVDDRLAASVPGVQPRVQLLLQVCSPGRARLVWELFAYLLRTGHEPSALPDDFYVRVGLVLAGRLPNHKILISLLSRSVLRAGTAKVGMGAAPHAAGVLIQQWQPPGVLTGGTAP
jgi:hypothetical protein